MPTTTSVAPADAERTAQPDEPRGPLGRVVAGSIAVGALGAALVPAGLLPGAREHLTTGAVLLAFAAGWALLAVLSTRLTSTPQRWALVPAAAMGVTGAGLLALSPGDAALQAAGYVWPPALLVLTVWVLVQVRRAMRSRARWVVYPVLGVLALSAVGGLVTTVAERDLRADAAPGRLVDVQDGRQLHLRCVGSGGPTVVLSNGLGGSSADWTLVVDAVAPTTRTCAYDRAGQGWSDPVGEPQDSDAVVADLHRLLQQAGEAGPFVLAGHSAGGAYAQAYAAQHPDDVVGVVLLDSMTPEQFTALPDFAGQYSWLRRMYGVTPTLARAGAGQLLRALSAPPAGPDGATALAVSVSPRSWRTARDEHSVYRRAMGQAAELSTLGDVPLTVVSATETLEGTRGWRAAQAALAGLSSTSTARTVDSTHAGLITDEAAARQVADAVRSTVETARARRAGGTE